MESHNPLLLLLDIAAGLLIVGLLLCAAYEVLALVNSHIPFTGNLPVITDIVRPWVAAHKALALGIAAIFIGAFFWLFFHFFLGK